MANTKRKLEETPKRSPGKSKFVFPNREAPPVDNTYFDRLFSELQQDTLDKEALTQNTEPSILKEANSPLENEEASDETALSSSQSASLLHPTERPETSHAEDKTHSFNELQDKKPLTQDLASKPVRRKSTSEKVEFKRPASLATSPKSEHIGVTLDQDLIAYCKPETSNHVDRLKLKYRLSKGEANVFRYLLGATHDKGQSECYITIPKLAEAVQLTTRGCQLSLKSLQLRGFVVRIEEYDPANRLGIKIYVNLISS